MYVGLYGLSSIIAVGTCDKNCLHFHYEFTVTLHTSRCSARYFHEFGINVPFFLSLDCLCSGDEGGHVRGRCPSGSCE